MRINRAKLAYELARRGWRQKKLVELTGLSKATISAMACGKTVAPDTAQKIAAALGMALEDLIE